MSTTSKLKRETVLQKRADIGGDPDRSFEQSFSSLAYAYIQDKAPGLLDYLVGFQLVDRNEDNTKAIGVFGFKVGDEWVYAPIFFLAGDMKGHELLYLKSKDTFVPMKENWVNYIISKRPQILGKAIDDNLEGLGVVSPNLSVLSSPPSGGTKYSSDMVPPKLRDWAKAAMPHIAQWATANPYNMDKYAGLDERLSFANFIKQDVSLVKLAMDVGRAYPTVKGALDSYYGKNLFRDALLDLKARVEKLAAPKIIKAAHADKEGYSVNGKYYKHDSKKKKKKKGVLAKSSLDAFVSSVEIITSQVVSDNLPELSSEEKKKLLNDGYVIKDRRTNDDISVAYNTQVSQSLANPDDTGIYDILVKPGDFSRCVVITSPYAGKDRKDFATVLNVDDNEWLNTPKTNLWARELADDVSETETYRTWYDDLSSDKSLSEDSTYLIVSSSGSGTTPFRVVEKITDNSYRVSWNDYAQGGRPRYLPTTSAGQAGANEADNFYEYHGENLIEFNSREGTSFKNIGGTLFIPEDSKVIKVDSPYSSYGDSSDRQPLRPGNLADVQLQIFQKTAGLKLYNDHHEVIVNDSRMSSKAALFHLIRDHGFREKMAKKLLKECARFGGARYRVKYAVAYPAMLGPGAPAFPAPEFSTDGSFGNVPTVAPTADTLPVDDMSAQMTDPSVYDPMAMPDPQALQVAQQAAQSGQQDIFDTALISSMLKSVRQESIVDKYLGDLMKALDRLGRILFMFYWHNEEFKDRYGKQDLPELEDTLRNSFEILGDLVLFLKQKTIDPMLGDTNPDIEEAARN